MCDWSEHHQAVAGPLVAYVLVHPSVRGGWGRAFAVITQGNAPSEALFGKLAFRRISD